MANVETNIQNTIRLAIGKLNNVRLFRNNVGMVKSIDGQVVHFGLCKGSSDLIGYVSKVITPEMVGQKVAIFTSIEVKTPDGKPTKQQVDFLHLVSKDGGISGIVRNVEQAEALCK